MLLLVVMGGRPVPVIPDVDVDRAKADHKPMCMATVVMMTRLVHDGVTATSTRRVSATLAPRVMGSLLGRMPAVRAWQLPSPTLSKRTRRNREQSS